MYKFFFKRIIDCFIALCGIVILFIPMFIIAIAIKINSKGPAIFKQLRLGRNKKSFTIFKFRTMSNNAYEMGGIASSETDSRITKVGKVLRRTSLDELPQLFNILSGTMAIIGPRPILDWEYNDNAKEEYESRFLARPGMFCTVDLNYRAAASRETQFIMDSKYVQAMSFKNDIIIFFKVIKTVITGKNIYKFKSEKLNDQQCKGDKILHNVK